MKINVIHQTDLFHYHCDPDDHWDLACQYALSYNGNMDLKAILIDYPPNADYGDPAIAAVNQLNYITGQAVPVGIGLSIEMLSKVNYTKASNLGPGFGGAKMVIKVLEEAAEPTVIHIVGSCRDIAIAWEIRPDLFREKCKAIYLNAGTSKDEDKVDYNVELDPHSYRAIFDIPCDIFWIPCIEYYPKPPALPYQFTMGEYSSFYEFRQDKILPYLSDNMQKYFAYALGKVTDQRWLSYLKMPKNQQILDYYGKLQRNMWSTVGFLHAVNKTVAKDGCVVALNTQETSAVFCFEPVHITCDSMGHTKWKITGKPTNRYILKVTDMENYQSAMTNAMKDLLSTLP